MTSTDYENPHRPVPVRLFNRLGRTGRRLGISDHLEVDALREAAARRTGLTDFDDDVDVAVHALCPGGVASNIARDAPRLLKPILDPVLRRFFRSPDEAIGPVVHLCCAPEAGDSTGLYLHLMNRKQVSEAASDPAHGARLWEASQTMVEKSRHAQD